MDAAELSELNDKIKARGETLGRLVLKRVSHVIRQHVPESRTVRVIKGEDGNFYLERVSGQSSKVIYRFANDKSAVEPASVFKLDVDQVIDDLVTYARVGGARLRKIESTGFDAYSIYLRTDI